MRPGPFRYILQDNTLTKDSYDKRELSEIHRIEFNDSYREQFENAGMRISGQSPGGMLVEIVELRNHPWFVATQFFPEFKLTPVKPHTLFRDFAGAALKSRTSKAN
ncbi:CTP synthase [Chitinispirillum alkaliphilum]|nr:CTP synthase [Chitinispirillum alkaliphilum]